jgi:sucrose-phosphate synthase
MKHREIQKKYKIDHRIAVEENILAHADLVITSTHQERREQYGMYRHHDLPDLRGDPAGHRHRQILPLLPRQAHRTEQPFRERPVRPGLHAQGPQPLFLNPGKTADPGPVPAGQAQEHLRPVKAYGEDLELQAMANLAIFAGIRKDIDTMEDNERDVLTRMLLLMDKYDLYGRMAIPKRHDFEYEVPALYRIAAESRGVFVNPALTEPFGLTLLEASATGLPIVATNDGGPNDIMRNCHNGILVDPTDPRPSPRP